MPYQNLQATLTAADRDEVLQLLQQVTAKLPFLISLTTAERKGLYKMGDRRLAFVRNCLQAARSNADILPRSFDLEGFQQDYELAMALHELLMVLQQLTEKVEDTVIAAGSEAMTSSLEFYDYAKTAAKRTPGLKGIVEQLGEAFKAVRTLGEEPEAADEENGSV